MYELVSPVNTKAILKYIGLLLVVFAVAMFVPVFAGIILDETGSAIYYAATSFVTLITGYPVYRLLPEFELETKEATIIAALIFPVSAFISSIPMSLSTGMPFIDAFFESVSAITTTGLSVAPADMNSLFFFTRSWSQWLGGIGIIIVVLAVFVHPGVTAFKLYKTTYEETKLRPNVIAATHLFGKVYIGITGIAFLFLFLSGMSVFDSICHAFSSVSTGGFSTQAESIGAFEGFIIPFIVIISCIMGSISFALYPEFFKNPKLLVNNLQFRYFCIIAIIGIPIYLLTLSNDIDSFINQVPDAGFQVFSALTTAGFSTVDLSSLPDSSKGLLSGLMWIGGSIGSTAGGIKIFRILVLAKVIQLIFYNYFLPREAITPLKVKDHVIETNELYTLISFVMLYVLTLVVSVFIFIIHDINTMDAIFEVSSAVGTVGLSAGVTDAAMPFTLKLVLCADMLLGRIEIIPLCILLMPRTWISRKNRQGGKV